MQKIFSERVISKSISFKKKVHNIVLITIVNYMGIVTIRNSYLLKQKLYALIVYSSLSGLIPIITNIRIVLKREFHNTLMPFILSQINIVFLLI